MALTAKKVYAILNGKIEKVSDDVSNIATPLVFKGSVETADLLPVFPEIGWMYNIESKSVYGEAGMNVAWTGEVWDSLGATIDLSLYMTAEEINNTFQKKYEVVETDTAPDSFQSNTLYIFPEMASLSVSLGAPVAGEYNEYHFIFVSGSTATVLTLPESVKTDLAVEPNRIYECSIVDNLLAWTSWAVN